MAFSKTPSISTHQLKRLEITASEMPVYSAFNDYGPKYVNCSPVKYSQFGTDPVRAVIPRPAIVANGTLPNNNIIRGVHHMSSIGNPVNSTEYTYFCQGNTVYVSSDSTMALPTSIGTLQYSTGYVGITTYSVAGNLYIIFVETHPTASYYHVYNVITTAFTSTNLTFGVAGDPIFLNGYIFLSSFPFNPGTPRQRIYNSDISNPATFSPSTDFIDTEIFPDNILFLAKHKNHLVAFGETSIEFFYDGANQLGSPLTRQPSYTVSLGGVMAWDYTSNNNNRPAYVHLGDDLYFIGKTPSGSYGVYAISDFQVKSVSDKFLNRVLNPLGSNMYGVQSSGRLFAFKDRGQTHLLLQFNDWADNTTPGGEINTEPLQAHRHYAFNPAENEWSQWELNDTATLVSEETPLTLDAWYIQGVVHLLEQSVFFIKRVTTGGVATQAVYHIYKSEDSTTYTNGAVYCRVIFPSTDFGAQQYKHIKYVDILGDFAPDTRVRLKYSTETTQMTYASPVAFVDSNKGPRRTRNITRARNVAFTVEFATTKSFLFHGLDVAYNLGRV